MQPLRLFPLLTDRWINEFWLFSCSGFCFLKVVFVSQLLYSKKNTKNTNAFVKSLEIEEKWIQNCVGNFYF